MYVRYYSPDEFGEIRRDRNETMAARSDTDIETPPLIVPEYARHLWDWYLSISGGVRRVVDGVCGPIEPVQWVAWQGLSGEIVRPSDYAILRAMDDAYCVAMNLELRDYQARREAEAAKKAEQEKGRRKRG